MATLYDRLGGEAAIEAAVVLFYEKIMADPALSPFFDELDMGAQIQKQIAFMKLAFGGPNKYTGRDLRTAHTRLVGHLTSTLEELGVEQPAIDELRGVEVDQREALAALRRMRASVA